MLIKIYHRHRFTFKFRSSHRRCSIKKCVLKNLSKFTGKHLCQGLFFDKIENYQKRDSGTGVFL